MTDLLGHSENEARFAKSISSGKLHHGWIFSGPRGVGKAAFAYKQAIKIIDPDDKFAPLFASGNHPDLLIIERPPKEAPKEGEAIDSNAERKRGIGVDQIRALQRRLTTRPGVSDKRVIIIDAADDMEISAANALLKSLEEPPVGTHFMLISHSSDRLLPTIRSRCQMMRFDPLNRQEMDSALKILLPDLNEAMRHILCDAGEGSPGNALAFVGMDLDQIDAAVEAIVLTGDANNELRSKLASSLSLKAGQPKYETFLRRVPKLILQYAEKQQADALPSFIKGWEAATSLAGRAIGVSLDKQSVVLQMGTILASLSQAKRH
jgi:DNA polymerase III subunit delta'